MKKWPWVSREHLEDTKQLMQQRINELELEKRQLLDRLLARVTPERRMAVAPVEEPEARAAAPIAEQGVPQSYTTPFDRIEARFAAVHKNGVYPEKFRARYN
jgi:hypothetical protein